MFDGRFRSGVDAAVKPVGEALRRTGLSPDHLTALGMALAAPAAWAIATGRLGLGLVLLVCSAVPDLLDGALAKASGRATIRGAFFDSVSDRVSDSLLLLGTAWYLQDRYHGHAFMLPVALLGLSLLISYQRAKAESLGLDAKGGLMERAERVVGLGIGLAWSLLLVPLLWVMLVLSAITAVQRFVKVWRQAAAALPARRQRRLGEPAVAARWRAWREANGFLPRASRYSGGTRRSGAAARWQERRRARKADGATLRWRSGSRRP